MILYLRDNLTVVLLPLLLLETRILFPLSTRAAVDNVDSHDVASDVFFHKAAGCFHFSIHFHESYCVYV